MPKFANKLKFLPTQQGFGQWIIIVVLLFGIGVGVWVAQIRTNFVPQAAVPEENSLHQTSLSIMLVENQKIAVDNLLVAQIYLRSDIDSSRLVSAQLKYDPEIIEVLKINTPKSGSDSAVIQASTEAEPKSLEISQWLELLFDNKSGILTLSGLSEEGNLKTDLNKKPMLLAEVIFKLKSPKSTTIYIEPTSLILRSADNVNILSKIENLELRGE